MSNTDVNLADADMLLKCGGPPIEMLRRWQESDPVHWNPVPEDYYNPNPRMKMTKGFWVLTRYQDVYDASRNPTLFSSALGGPVIWDLEGNALKAQQAGLMGMDPPNHVRVKSLVVSPFMPRRMDAFTPEIQEVVADIIGAIADKGECEFVFDVASRLPVYTFCVLMGVPPEDRDRVFQIGNAMADTDNYHDINALHAEMAALALKVTELKRAHPDETMMSAYANAEVDGKPLSQSKITAFFTTIAIAGHETTRNTASHFVRLMAEYPDQRELLLSDLNTHLPNAISEVLRFAPPVMQFRRTASADTEIGGKAIKAGDKIYLSYVAANRDPSVFPDPDRFDITRDNAGKHLSFGIGQHACLGARLASLQLKLLLEAVYTRLPDIAPTEPSDYLNNIMFNGLRQMPVRFTPEQRAS
jgi:cholest-4-en-3-one 26-monooxygenase